MSVQVLRGTSQREESRSWGSLFPTGFDSISDRQAATRASSFTYFQTHPWKCLSFTRVFLSQSEGEVLRKLWVSNEMSEVSGDRLKTSILHAEARGRPFGAATGNPLQGPPVEMGSDRQKPEQHNTWFVAQPKQTEKGQKTVNCSLWKKDDNEYFCTLLGHKKETNSVLILKMPELYLYAFISNEKVYLTEHARCSKTKGTFLFGHLLCLSCSDGENVGLPIEKKPQSFTSSLGFFSLSLCSLKMRAAHS